MGPNKSDKNNLSSMLYSNQPINSKNNIFSGKQLQNIKFVHQGGDNNRNNSNNLYFDNSGGKPMQIQV